jgi:hypothetical protein
MKKNRQTLIFIYQKANREGMYNVRPQEASWFALAATAALPPGTSEGRHCSMKPENPKTILGKVR